MNDRTAAPSAADLGTLLDGLSVRAVEAALAFDDAVKITPLATKTLRGLVGNALEKIEPELASKHFRNARQPNAPPAFCFRPAIDSPTVEGGIPFRLVTWDRDDRLLEALLIALETAIEDHRPFGEKGSAVTALAVGDILPLHFPGDEDRPALSRRLRVHLVTPLCLKTRTPEPGEPPPGKNGRRVPERAIPSGEFTFGHLVRAAANRLNNLSRFHGAGTELTIRHWTARAATVREIDRELADEQASRHSSRQGKKISFHGITGELEVANVPAQLADLLEASALFQVGHHTTSGCGAFRLAIEP